MGLQSAGEETDRQTPSNSLTGVLEAGLASYKIESKVPSGSTDGGSRVLAKANETDLSRFKGVFDGTV